MIFLDWFNRIPWQIDKREQKIRCLRLLTNSPHLQAVCLR